MGFLELAELDPKLRGWASLPSVNAVLAYAVLAQEDTSGRVGGSLHPLPFENEERGGVLVRAPSAIPPSLLHSDQIFGLCKTTPEKDSQQLQCMQLENERY